MTPDGLELGLPATEHIAYLAKGTSKPYDPSGSLSCRKTGVVQAQEVSRRSKYVASQDHRRTTFLVLRSPNPAQDSPAGRRADQTFCSYRVITPLQALQSINLNVLGIFVGTMILSDFFIHSQVPAYLTSVLVNPKRSIAGAVLAVCILSGAISAVVDNVATVLMIAPIALEVSRQLCISPVPFMIGISVSANLQGAGTMVGDSTSILLASTANMTFTDFFWMNGRPGIFFSVQLAAVASFIVLYLVFRAYKGKCVAAKRIRVTSWVPTVLMVLMMVTMAVSSFLPNRP